MIRMRLLLCLSTLALVTAFCPNPRSTSTITTRFLATPEESAAALTEFMAKAHEEKVAAMARVEAQYKQEIEELKAKVEELEGPKTGSEATSQNSFAFPATNKALAEKVVAYQTFISGYIVKAQAEKQKTVKDAEANLVEKYEAKMASLQEVTAEPLQ